jgi:hypothetical protein
MIIVVLNQADATEPSSTPHRQGRRYNRQKTLTKHTMLDTRRPPSVYIEREDLTPNQTDLTNLIQSITIHKMFTWTLSWAGNRLVGVVPGTRAEPPRLYTVAPLQWSSRMYKKDKEWMNWTVLTITTSSLSVYSQHVIKHYSSSKPSAREEKRRSNNK